MLRDETTCLWRQLPNMHITLHHKNIGSSSPCKHQYTECQIALPFPNNLARKSNRSRQQFLPFLFSAEKLYFSLSTLLTKKKKGREEPQERNGRTGHTSFNWTLSSGQAIKSHQMAPFPLLTFCGTTIYTFINLVKHLHTAFISFCIELKAVYTGRLIINLFFFKWGSTDICSVRIHRTLNTPDVSVQEQSSSWMCSALSKLSHQPSLGSQVNYLVSI